jgi:hypothetical protein
MGRNRTIGAPYQTTTITESVTTDHSVDAYLVNAASGSPVTVTLDPNAVANDQVLVQDAAGNAASQPIDIVASEGQTILNAGSSLAISSNGGAVQFTYSAELSGWTAQVTSGGTSAGSGQIATGGSTNGSATPSAAVTFFDVTYTPKTTGHLRVDAVMSVLGTASDSVQYQLRLAAAADPSSVVVNQPCGADGHSTATINGVYPCTAGTPITLGIQATDSTGGHTVQSGIGNTRVMLQELQTHLSG